MDALSDKSEVKLDVKTLIGIIFGIVSIAGIWFSLTADISQLHTQVNKMENIVLKNREWVENFEPPITVQETVVQVRELKTENELLKYRIKQLEKIVKK